MAVKSYEGIVSTTIYECKIERKDGSNVMSDEVY